MEGKQLGQEEMLANGDPVIALRLDIHEHDNGTVSTSREVVTLGTGFEGWGSLYGHAETAIETGEPTTFIPPEAAETLEGADDVRFFTAAAMLKDES